MPFALRTDPSMQEQVKICSLIELQMRRERWKNPSIWKPMGGECLVGTEPQILCMNSVRISGWLRTMQAQLELKEPDSAGVPRSTRKAVSIIELSP